MKEEVEPELRRKTWSTERKIQDWNYVKMSEMKGLHRTKEKVTKVKHLKNFSI